MRNFYGRDNELKTLHAVYARLCYASSSSSSSQVQPKSNMNDNASIVLISGPPGTGKSALVGEFASQIQQKSTTTTTTGNGKIKPCYFLSGKFNDLDGGYPFTVFSEAFEGFCRQVFNGEDETFGHMQGAIKTAVGTEGKALIEAIPPGLSSILGDEHDMPSSRSDAENSWNRLLYLFKSFLRAICSENRPIVLFLDDLQKADDASLTLLTDLLTDKLLHNLMFVGAYRSDEVNRVHPLARILTAIEEARSVAKIDLADLSPCTIGALVANALNLQVEETSLLTEVVYKKTEGNISFVLQVIEELRRKDLLRMSETGSRWVWDVEQIDLLSSISGDVVEAVASKIQFLPEKQQRMLSIAAFMRFNFDVDTLLTMMHADDIEVCQEELSKLLENAVFEGLLLNSIGSHIYKFTHNRIKEAAFSLLTRDSDLYSKVRLCLAKHLMKRGKSNDGEDWMLFIAADHLNDITNHDMDPLEMTNLNLEVGEKAIKVPAFVQASNYLKQGIAALGALASPWEHHYELTLRLYQAAADTEVCLGHFQRGAKYCQLIIDHARSALQRLQAQFSLAESLGRQNRHGESMDVHARALRQVGEFPKHFLAVHTACNYRQMAGIFRKNSDFDIFLLPPMTDQYKLAVMDHLARFSLRAYECKKTGVALLCILKQIRMTFEYGLSQDSALAFVLYGAMVFGRFRDSEIGRRMVRLSTQILQRTDLVGTKKAANTRAICTACMYINAYSIPLSQVLETLRAGQRSGFVSGDSEEWLNAWWVCNVHAYTAGFSLNSVEESGARLLQQACLYKLESVVSILNEFRWVVLHLTGLSVVQPMNLSAIMSTVDKSWWGDVRAPTTSGHTTWFYWARLQIAYYFREFEIAAQLIAPFENHAASDTSFVVTSPRIFFTGLTASALARKTGKRKHYRRAKRALKEMKTMTSKQGLNNLHRFKIMEADLLSCKGSKADAKKAKESFDLAIATSDKAGFLQDTALANELAGEFYLKILGAESSSRHYFTEAYHLYKKWGAVAKADHLKELRPSYIQRTSVFLICRGISTHREHASVEVSDSNSFRDSLLADQNISMTFLRPQLGLVRAVYATDDSSTVISDVTIPSAFLPARAKKDTPSCVTPEATKSSSELHCP